MMKTQKTTKVYIVCSAFGKVEFSSRGQALAHANHLTRLNASLGRPRILEVAK